MAALGYPFAFIIAYHGDDLVYEYGSYELVKSIVEGCYPAFGILRYDKSDTGGDLLIAAFLDSGNSRIEVNSNISARSIIYTPTGQLKNYINL